MLNLHISLFLKKKINREKNRAGDLFKETFKYDPPEPPCRLAHDKILDLLLPLTFEHAGAGIL